VEKEKGKEKGESWRENLTEVRAVWRRRYDESSRQEEVGAFVHVSLVPRHNKDGPFHAVYISYTAGLCWFCSSKCDPKGKRLVWFFFFSIGMFFFFYFLFTFAARNMGLSAVVACFGGALRLEFGRVVALGSDGCSSSVASQVGGGSVRHRALLPLKIAEGENREKPTRKNRSSIFKKPPKKTPSEAVFPKRRSLFLGSVGASGWTQMCCKV
jgi:hypothetical protein